MKRTEVKQLLKAAGYEGKVYFLKSSEFGRPNGAPFLPAIHRRIWSQYDIDHAAEDAERDGFNLIVCYLEPKSYYEARSRLCDSKHVWTEGEINGLRKQLGFCTNWSKAAAEDLREEIQRMSFPAFRITKEQTKFGLEWLKRTQFRQNGELRTSAFIGNREAEIIRNFARFEFVGLSFQAVNPYTGFPQCIAPLYRTTSKSGKSFTYRVSPMGGFSANYEVVS